MKKTAATNRGGRDDGPWHDSAAAATAARVAAAVLEAAAPPSARAVTRLRSAWLLIVAGPRLGGCRLLSWGAGHACSAPTQSLEQAQPLVAHL